MTRWPERECFHENLLFSLAIRLSTGEVVSSVPVECMDCGFFFKDEA